jgi:hypothetical protein
MSNAAQVQAMSHRCKGKFVRDADADSWVACHRVEEVPDDRQTLSLASSRGMLARRGRGIGRDGVVFG